MFLALNELIKEKSRFILIATVIALVSYLTFFLTALAYGLATSYTQGIDKWQASGILLQKDANNNIARSLLHEADFDSVRGADAARLGVSTATVELEKAKDVALFGIEKSSFLQPNITEGRAATAATEIVASDTLKKIGLRVGALLQLKGGETSYTVVGFTNNATFQTAPIVYMSLDEWRVTASELAGMVGMKDSSTISAIVTETVSNDFTYDQDEMIWQSIKDFSFALPGYNAQVLTFSTMIGFLIAIASFVLAIFMYILTLQKKSMFGVLKAEGIPNKYIARSVKTQIVVLSSLGMAVGLALTLISGAALGDKIPFLVQPLFFIAIIALFLLCAAIGGIASVWAVTKIDPVEAIG